MMSAGGGVINPLPGGVVSTTTVGGFPSATLNVNRAGTITGNPDIDDTFVDRDWAMGPSATVGDAYWVRFTQVTGSTLDTGLALLAVWSQLSADRSIGYIRATNGTDIGTFTVEIATDSGGVNIVGTSTSGAFTITATRSP
jgi:hypothetical protein